MCFVCELKNGVAQALANKVDAEMVELYERTNIHPVTSAKSSHKMVEASPDA
jgi:hypothetical protein